MSVKRKSLLPVYGIAVIWILYCAFFPLYLYWHFIIPTCLSVLAYILLSKIFPGKTEFVEIVQEPERTGDKLVDELLAEGEKTVAELTGISLGITNDKAIIKINELIVITDKIFKDLITDPGDFKKIKRFSELYLPTTLKLLRTYESFEHDAAAGGNIAGTLERIDLALDTIISSYEKFFDSLFEDQALDIETDIAVLKTMLKNEGLLEREF